jgi:hypothetical protein
MYKKLTPQIALDLYMHKSMHLLCILNLHFHTYISYISLCNVWG